ncbi:MAG TPA: hypothetical protein PLB49_11920 [Chitinophagaceae bacterium]|nr:hypothetical protein [Chitinophagaceae bacterium]HPH32556.1 hypothetical protein [Chitinophagaceae bacterium]
MISFNKSWFKIAVLFGSLLILLASCADHKKPDTEPTPVITRLPPITDSLLITDSSWGLIQKDMNYSDLKVIYGAGNLKDERICGPECVDSVDVTKLFPGTINEAIIYWKDKAWHKTIAMIMCYQDSALYHTDKGLKLKSGFNELLRLNGKKISFMGFGWDYGGTITSYNEGLLENTPLRYEIDLSKAPSEEEMSVFGDTPLDSDMPLVKKLVPDIYIRKFTLVLNNHEY